MKPEPIYHIASIDFWKCYLIHMRPYLLFVSAAAGIMGTSLYPAGLDYLQFSLSLIPFFFGYGFGQALTDAFQTDTDKISSPYRPLSKGIISRNQVLAVSLSGLFIIAGILIYFSWYNIFFCLFSIIGLATYSYVKRFWAFGPFHNSWIVMLLPMMGYLAMGGSIRLVDRDFKTWFPYLITLFSYCNFVLIGYLKDIEADRQTGYNTFPVVFGWKPTLWLGNVNIVIYLILSFRVLSSLYSISGILFIITAIVAIAGQLKGHLAKEHTPHLATIPVVSTVRAFILIHIMIIVEKKPELLLFCVLFYALFEVTLWKRPEKTQV